MFTRKQQCKFRVIRHSEKGRNDGNGGGGDTRTDRERMIHHCVMTPYVCTYDYADVIDEQQNEIHT